MRIISGKYKGRVIRPPGNLPVRPTTDFAKTGLFNILENRFELDRFHCLDLFSGTGSISLELISRGCAYVSAIDQDQKCVSFLKTTSAGLGINNLAVVRSDVMQYLKKTTSKFDLIFADPPFDLQIRTELCKIVLENKILKEQGVFILEHVWRESYDHIQGFIFKRKYGNVSFSFFSNLESLTPLHAY